MPKPGRQKQSEFHLFQHLAGVAGIAPDSEDDGRVHMDCIHSYSPVSILNLEHAWIPTHKDFVVDNGGFHYLLQTVGCPRKAISNSFPE